MSLPNNTLSTRPIVAPFLAPRTQVRASNVQGLTDVHYGGVAIGNPSLGLSYQIWTATCPDGLNIWLSAPNTAPFIFLAGVTPVWVALSFDQNSRPFIGYVTAVGTAYFYWFNTLVNQFVTTQLPPSALYDRVFASVDDLRPQNITNSDTIIAYVRSGSLFYRQQRDRYGIEYTLGAAPGKLVQIGMNSHWRFQFAFLNVMGDRYLPPQEWNPALGINEPA
jgi:hypothetical protein